MGLFDIFGKKNDKEAELEKEKALEEQKEKTIEDRKKAYEGLEWPCIQRLNPVNIKDAEGEVMEETVPLERKDEIGAMIFDEDISPDTLKFLSGQELLFLLTALEVFNKKAPLPDLRRTTGRSTTRCWEGSGMQRHFLFSTTGPQGIHT